MALKKRANQAAAVLDGLESPSVTEVADAMVEFDAGDVAVAAAHKALSAGAFTGWADDPDAPGTVNGGNGSLFFDDGSSNNQFSAHGWTLNKDDGDDDTEAYYCFFEQGFNSNPPPGVAAYNAYADAGGLASLDCDGLPILNLPTSDPHILGALWNNDGTPAFSTGP